MEFLEKIFSIKDYGETHKIMRLLGLKIKFPKTEYAKKKKESLYYYYKKNNIDIRKLPSATGQLRDIQLANLALLKELDYVCKQNGLQYWLNYGTLLGAVRHKGFIPWDDDIDVSMIRNDYDKIVNAFQNNSKNKNIYAEETYLGNAQAIIKIKHKKCPHLFVDIFPCDYSNKISNKQNRISQTKKLYKIRQLIKKNKSLNTPIKVIKAIKKFNKDIIPNDFIEHSDIQYGLEYFYTEPIWIFSYNTIFPLKTIKFEDFEAMSINQPEQYLSEIYENYMSYPKNIGYGHSMFCLLTKEEKKYITLLKNYEEDI